MHLAPWGWVFSFFPRVVLMIPDIGWVADGSMAPDQLIAFSTFSALLWETSNIEMEDKDTLSYYQLYIYLLFFISTKKIML